MNKYTARALHEQAALGRRVLVVTETLNSAQFALDAMEDEAFPGVVEITRDGSDQHISYESGGIVTVVSDQGSGYVGKHADLVFIDADMTDRYDLDLTLFFPCVKNSTSREIIRA